MNKTIDKTIDKTKKFWDSQVLKVVALVALSRIAVLILSYVFYLVRTPEGTIGAFIDWLSQCGDVPHYIRIAQEGYTVGGEWDHLIAFYPLFPMLIKLVGFVVGDHLIAGIFISNICAILAGVYMFKLVKIDYSEKTASMAVLFMFLYPFSFFMSFCYTESLFIMLSLMCIYYTRQGKWIATGIIGFFAALTRTQGIVLFGVAAYEWVIQAREKVQAKTLGEGFKEFFKGLRWTGVFSLLIPAGYGVYLSLNKYLFGDWFKFLEFQKSAPWYQESGFIPENLMGHLGMSVDHPGLAIIMYIPQFLVFVLAFAMIFAGVKYKVRTSYLLHIAAYTVASFLSTWLISGGRYMLSCLMMFVPMAVLAKNKVWRYVITVTMTALGLIMFYLYISGFAIM